MNMRVRQKKKKPNAFMMVSYRRSGNKPDLGTSKKKDGKQVECSYDQSYEHSGKRGVNGRFWVTVVMSVARWCGVDYGCCYCGGACTGERSLSGLL